MKAKREIDFDDCPHCGDSIYSMTADSLEEGFYYDGDEVACDACGPVGTMVADSEVCYVSYSEDT